MLIMLRFASISAVLAGGVLGVAACGQAPPRSAPVISLTQSPQAPASTALAATPPATPASVSPAAAPVSAPPKEDPPGLSRVPDAAFGGLALGVSDADAIKLLGAPATRSKVQFSQVSALKLSTWTWPAKGVQLEMDWTTKPGHAVVNQIVLKAPSTLKNPQGIGIGSSRAEVLAAVGSRLSVEHPPDEDFIVMGSVYDGVHFNVAGGRVAIIVVGASGPE